MKISEIHEEWNVDSVINSDLEQATHDIPRLHAKYMRIISSEKQRLTKLENDHKTLLKRKMMYYDGKFSKEEADEYGWDYNPFGGYNTPPSKAKIEMFYDADTDIQKSITKIDNQQIRINTLKEIIDSLKWRHLSIRNVLETRKFNAGF